MSKQEKMLAVEKLFLKSIPVRDIPRAFEKRYPNETISVATVQRYLHALGYRRIRKRKGVFVSGWKDPEGFTRLACRHVCRDKIKNKRHKRSSPS